jgi:hypothetical protein
MKAGILGFIFGAALALAFCSWPMEPQGFTFRAKERCLTTEGLSLKIRYRGWGVAQFVVLPPETKEAVK